MANEKAVENSQPAATEGVENGSNAPGTEKKIDWEAEAKQAIADRAQAEADRDHYKKGLLMAKGKIEDDGSSDRIADEATDISKIVAEQVKKAVEPFVKQNEEMKVALANRSQIQSHSSSGSQETLGGEVKKEFWSAEQLATFKKLKIDPTKVYENWQKKINK